MLLPLLQNNLLVSGKTLSAEAGSYTLTGTAASLEYGREVAAAAGSYAVAGAAASLEYGREVAAAAASYAVAGAAAGLLRTRLLGAAAGSYAVTGAAASLEYGREVAANAGSYAVTGAEAQLTATAPKSLSAEPGSYLITGTAVNLVYDTASDDTHDGIDWKPWTEKRRPPVDRREKALEAWTVEAEAGAYAISGSPAQLVALVAVVAEPGTYMVTGSSAQLALAIADFDYAADDSELFSLVEMAERTPPRRIRLGRYLTL